MSELVNKIKYITMTPQSYEKVITIVTTDDPQWLQQAAHIIINVKTGCIVKNSFGPINTH
jgi:hypothetical protein